MSAESWLPRSGLARTWQASELFDDLTVGENLAVYEEFEKFYEIVPRRMLLNRSQQLVVRRRLADMYFWFFCRGGYLRIGDYRNAHRYLSKCIRLRPLRLLFWREYLLNLVRMARTPSIETS